MASFQSREEGTDQELIQSSTIPDPEHHIRSDKNIRKYTTQATFPVYTFCRLLDLGKKFSMALKIFTIHSLVIEIQTKIVSEYDQEIPQSQTADNPLAPQGRAAQPSRDTRKTNQAKQPALSSPSR